ncbi:endonuclease/exonuclease/phosphatase family protein [Acaryochloris sp. IP29b_bin.137]|uniref:endonuclease/exonuclease/phosphatase family protein n=1 Tax=Acaryochloris sp. IP29b_bin.137 TaxID=2969217 RepID=UPI00261C1A5B|nr:endonuclease/exonuclease/phosphatase family protein [Acaryochloris sp. IP29b_bin.137]
MFYRLTSTALLLLSGIQVLVYYSPLKFRWPLAVLVELWPYGGMLPFLSFVWVVAISRLRRQPIRVSLATLLLILIWTPVLNWVGLPPLGASPTGLRVMAYNLWIDNPNIEAIEQSILGEAPDILFLSEVSKPMMAELQARLDFPHSYRTSGSNNALFSRYPILDATTTDFGVKTKGRTFSLMAQLQVKDDPVTVIGVHPPVPIFQTLFHIRNQQLDSFAKVSESIAGKVIVLGDFNATPWSPHFQRFERISQLQNVGHRQWIWATWYFNQTLSTRYIKIPLDHIETRGFKVQKTWTGQTGGSDHKPIITVLKPA